MARIKYYNPTTQQWEYADSNPLPTGQDGDILVNENGVWVARQPSRLPAAYQEVEYIESTGTQYIDTGIPAKSIYDVSGDIKFTSLSPIQLFGCYDINNYNYTAFSFGIRSSGKFSLYKTGTSAQSEVADATTDRFQFTLSTLNGRYFFGFSSGTFTETAPTSDKPFILFARYNIDRDAVETFCSMRVYRIMMRTADTVVSNDFIPCYRKSDGEIGMYDLVSNQFFTNAGTGTFLKGADI